MRTVLAIHLSIPIGVCVRDAAAAVPRGCLVLVLRAPIVAIQGAVPVGVDVWEAATAMPREARAPHLREARHLQKDAASVLADQPQTTHEKTR